MPSLAISQSRVLLFDLLFPLGIGLYSALAATFTFRNPTLQGASPFGVTFANNRFVFARSSMIDSSIDRCARVRSGGNGFAWKPVQVASLLGWWWFAVPPVGDTNAVNAPTTEEK
jgi:hypothetical protein